jgi:parallel beta-helix repeat protein
VFLDGTPLKQVSGTPTTGQFSVNASRQVVLGDDPSGRTVEVATRTAWVRGGATNVTIDNVDMKHAANDSQNAAGVRNDGYSNWTLKNSDLSYSHGALVSFVTGTGLNIQGNTLHHGGQLGIHGSTGTLTISGNTIHDNNISGFNPAWEAGGTKHTRMTSLTTENNHVYNNYGVALWCDISCTNWTVRSNRVHHNQDIGIFFEISDTAKIYNNTVWENGWMSNNMGSWNSGIRIANSRNAEVYGNTVAWNASPQIAVTRQDRGNTTWNEVYGNYVHDNQIFGEEQ